MRVGVDERAPSTAPPKVAATAQAAQQNDPELKRRLLVELERTRARLETDAKLPTGGSVPSSSDILDLLQESNLSYRGRIEGRMEKSGLPLSALVELAHKAAELSRSVGGTPSAGRLFCDVLGH